MEALTTKLLSLVLCLVVSPQRNEALKAPFSLAVVPTHTAGDRGYITMAHDTTNVFYVVLTNVSEQPQSVWEYWNSWGYQTISFELTTDDGRKFVASREAENFTRNFPSTFQVQPGEHQVYAICLDKRWQTHPSFPKADEMPITLKATYQVSFTPEASKYKVWTGRVESKTYNISLRQW